MFRLAIAIGARVGLSILATRRSTESRVVAQELLDSHQHHTSLQVGSFFSTKGVATAEFNISVVCSTYSRHTYRCCLRTDRHLLQARCPDQLAACLSLEQVQEQEALECS